MPTWARVLSDREVWLTVLITSGVMFITPVVTSVAQPERSSGDQIAQSGSAWHFRRGEVCFMRRINRVRQSRGRQALNWDRQAGYVARNHARAMAKRGYVFHDANLGQVITRWRALGQNSGKGSGCRELFRAFMRSSGHRSNILGRWRHMGVGVESARGRVYVQQVFEHRRDPGNIWHRP